MQVAVGTVTHEVTWTVRLGPGWLRLLLAALYLGLPRMAAPGETDTDHPGSLLLSPHNSYGMPSGAMKSMIVTGSVNLGRSWDSATPSGMTNPACGGACPNVSVVFVPNGGTVGIGTPTSIIPTPPSYAGNANFNTNFTLHVKGHVALGGCFYLNGAPRCTW